MIDSTLAYLEQSFIVDALGDQVINVGLENNRLIDYFESS